MFLTSELSTHKIISFPEKLLKRQAPFSMSIGNGKLMHECSPKTLYPEWPHRPQQIQHGCLACWICKVDYALSWDCTDLCFAPGAQVVLPMRKALGHRRLYLYSRMGTAGMKWDKDTEAGGKKRSMHLWKEEERTRKGSVESVDESVDEWVNEPNLHL